MEVSSRIVPVVRENVHTGRISRHVHALDLTLRETLCGISAYAGSPSVQLSVEPEGERDYLPALRRPSGCGMTSTDYLTQDGLSEFDLAHLTEIIREGYGDWYHANLMRELHLLLPHADSTNTARLESAYPGSIAAYRIWYNDPSVEGRAV